MKRTWFIAVVAASSLALAACSDDAGLGMTELPASASSTPSQLGEILGCTIENWSEETRSVVLVYNPLSDQLEMIINPHEEESDTSHMVRPFKVNTGETVSGPNPQDPPINVKWIKAGHADNKAEAILLGINLAKKLPSDKTIYIKVEPSQGGGWDVYYSIGK